MNFFNLRTARQLAVSVINVVFPGSCALCRGEIHGRNQGETQNKIRHTHQGALCIDCSTQYLANPTRRCEVCALKLPDAHARACGSCLQSPPAFDATIVACDYTAPADVLVKDLKFRARLALAETFAQHLARAMGSQLSERPGLIVPVPLSEARLMARGFNQAAEIARSLARRTGIPLDLHLCARIRDTQPQAGLPVSERRVNMRGAFTTRLDASALSQLRDRHVLLVDDVITTGHTLSELAACLKRQGAARVTNAVFARTPYH